MVLASHLLGKETPQQVALWMKQLVPVRLSFREAMHVRLESAHRVVFRRTNFQPCHDPRQHVSSLKAVRVQLTDRRVRVVPI